MLETRDLPSGVTPAHVLRPAPDGILPAATAGPTGYTPSQVRHAYGFDQVNFGGVAGDGSGTTIAIVDAYDDPTVAGDLQQFDQRFGLPDPVLTKVNQSGGSTMPAANTGWAQEIALDVEWAHAIAPKAHLLLVEASSNSYTNLFAGVDYAARQPGVVAVSMSWGGGEFGSETSFDSHFETPAGHSGVAFIVSSGDSGAPASYPAASPNVLAVGGTSLHLDTTSAYAGESGWSGSGGGPSSYEAQPGYQQGVVVQTATARANPDVAYDADPNTGVPVYITYGNSPTAPWMQFGGTSAGAPQWAALVAIADQGRALQGLGSLDGATQLLPMIYGLAAADFHDVASGTSTGATAYTAGAGYDYVTGRGSPVANLVVADLVGQPATPTATHLAVSAPTGATAGSSFSVTVTALDGNNQPVPSYTGTVHFSSSDGSADLPANYSFTAGDQGVHTFAVTLRGAGSQTVTATDVARSTVSGGAGVTVTPAAGTTLAVAGFPSPVTAGTTGTFTVTAYDAYGNVAAGYAGTVHFTSSDPHAVLPADATLSNGQGSFSAVLKTVGTQSLTATDTAASGVSGTEGGISVQPAATTGTVIEDFETSQTYHVVGTQMTAVRASSAAHDGTYGLRDTSGSDWIYRSDAAAQVKQGDTVSVWLQLAGTADGRAFFGFGASSGGTLSIVAAANTSQLLIEDNSGYGAKVIASGGQKFLVNHWYRLEVAWGTGGSLTGRLYDSNGTTLLNTVTATDNAIASGGIAFRATGSDKYWDTVTVTHGTSVSTAPAPLARALPEEHPAATAASAVAREAGRPADGARSEATALDELHSLKGSDAYVPPAARKSTPDADWLDQLFAAE